jgi:hypothetical protein
VRVRITPPPPINLLRRLTCPVLSTSTLSASRMNRFQCSCVVSLSSRDRNGASISLSDQKAVQGQSVLALSDPPTEWEIRSPSPNIVH